MADEGSPEFNVHDALNGEGAGECLFVGIQS